MALKVVISHKTTYKYDRMINLSPHVIRLRPAPHSRTPIEAYSIKIKPENNFFNWQQDPFGNYQARLVFPEKTNELSIDVEIIADLKTINPFDFFIEESAEEFPFQYDETLQKELIPYLEIRESGKLLIEWIKTVDQSQRKTIDFLIELNQKLFKHLNYTIRMEPGVQSCEQTLQKGSGSCRDFAWLLVQVLRHLGIGARFVSGYLVQLTADEKSLDGPSGPEADFTDLHAWAEAYVPGAGWIGFDATSGLLAGEGHIPLACTPSYESAAPVTGYTDVCQTEFFHSNSVTRIFESPRVTKPYTDDQWQAIYNLGFEVEKELQEGDVRLTMGGEPTFVSIDDMESEQWNTSADGEHKRELAANLSNRLLERFGKGGVLHHAQGKWYPGEALPRWQIGIYWRKDGLPVWKDPSLLASFTKEYKVDSKTPELFLKTLTQYLGMSTETILPAYEDVFYFLWEEGKLPVDVDPLKSDLKDPLERKRLSEILNTGMNEPVGFILPLNHFQQNWISSKWEFRRNNLFLTPGTSPVGLRLPLDSLLESPTMDSEPTFEPDLFAETDHLGQYDKIVQSRKKAGPKKLTELQPFIRTAICAEVREKKLYVFLPPFESAEVFLDLTAALEASAAELKIPIIIEGYEPPRDNRIELLKVTPDPGVIEVNIHPAKNWKELTDNTLTLYEEAKQARLGTEKFMLDGKHTGTGGGNHVTLGGSSPTDSPLLRSPSLLRSLLTFWQHHPGLSYLFSGAFIGPTSQAPRVDEGRYENLYELEIAFEQIPEGKEVPYWLTDRLFRHMLTDITGNTHRAEFCIDKLYSPDSSSGRLGILELRAFDMPPHAQMSLMQMLLVRTLVAWFWKKPYKHKLVRWGTELHDRFLMEHYVKEDIKDIVTQLNEAGYPFKLDWFDPFFEFRFPLYGMMNIQGIDLELRMAVEPWNVLGEEMSGRGTSRYVDSSIERVQIKLNNFVDERYTLTCNGLKVPMTSTGKKGEFVSGIRYKAWQPWSSLHPTIGVDTPLVFDIVDTWNKRSIGGCTYFVSHPGGRSYDTYPVNSYEAESRRINRFWDIGHTQGEIAAPETQAINQEPGRTIAQHSALKTFDYKEIPVSMEFPHTLDLRHNWKTD
ncbi:transglutaminase family protein [Mangrovibacterium lignilyticum]|uniref:transglutaminase family protein n=1 Tax=Mangrovibacterium lignilyticum TaxID=2668052 RepID=UPI0013D2A4E5|nr:transglutaminase family protein [Mangrovibacterium lignilyticum]